MNNIIKTCQGCGIKFKPNFPTQRYHSKLCWDTSAENSERMLERWRNDPEFRALQREATREHWRKPEFRAQMIEVLKANNIRLAKRSAPAGSSNDRD